MKKNDQKIYDSEIFNRVCKFFGKINKITENSTLWSLSRCVKDGEALISFFGELAWIGLISQVDKIFIYGKGHYPLVNMLSTCGTKDKFFEMIYTLPKEDHRYRDAQDGRTQTYQAG